MATSQQVRSDTKTGQWSSIFPTEQVTETQSTLFVKKLLAVAISSITYLRALFPENAFGDRCLEDVNLKILRDDSSCPEACRVIQWIRGCFDALSKKYLKSVLVGIYIDPEDPDTVIEQYMFKFAYGDGAGIDIYRNGAKLTTAKSDVETKKATVRLLRTILLLSQSLNPLPDDVMMTMKLIYYDDVTPTDYNPPGFKDCHHDGFDFKEEPLSIKVGDVATQFHSFKLRIKTAHHDLMDANEEVIGIDDEIMPAKMERKEVSAMLDEKPPQRDEKHAVQRDECSPVKGNDAPTPLQSNTRISTPASSMVADSEQHEAVITNCSCRMNEDDGLMILCASCNTWQHATCFAILNPEDAPDVHFCVDCSKSNPDHVCTDVRLASVTDSSEIQSVCLWRRALVAVLETKVVSAPNLSKRLGISVVLATNLLKRMEEEGFAKGSGKAKRFGKVVQKSAIMGRGFDKYFKGTASGENEEIEMMSEQASGLNISASTQQSESLVKSSSKRKSVEEVFSSKNTDLRFELSNSQTSPNSQDPSARKRRKTSVAVEAMRV